MQITPKEKRINIIFALLTTVFFILIVRLIFLQLIKAPKYRELARENYVKPVPVEAPRGIVYDRSGQVLADNIPTYTIIIDSNTVTKEEYMELASLLLETGQPQAKFETIPKSPHYTIRKVPFEVICKIEETRERFLNVSIIAQPLRRYPYQEIFLHPIGYTGEISREELKTYSGYRLGQFVGKLGIEKKYEKFLQGKGGTKYVEIDVRGRELSQISYTPPESGCDVWLNIDADLQAFVYDILPNKGACIITNPETGEVLVWVSKPGFDPNIFSTGITPQVWNNLLQDTLKPLWDRCKAPHPPASVFKLVTCASGLEKGIIGPNSRQPESCDGKMFIGRREYKCWETHRSLNLMDAIFQSCDVYFYQLGIKLGVDGICKQARKLGFGKKVGIDIPGEYEGKIPSAAWYDKKYGKGRWGKGIAANLSVGQGEILCTPLQILQFVSGIANGGMTYTPSLVKKIVDSKGAEIFTHIPSRSYNLPLKKETIAILRKGMWGVVNAEKGTGRLARVPGIEAAGKTGTAQNPHGEDHAWFVAFAPYEKPQICIVVFIENGGMGGSVAAPIAGRIIQNYFNIQLL